MCCVLFSDIDGTLLDAEYSIDVVLPKIYALKCPLIFCTTKTHAEIEYYRKICNVNDPFIVENGSAIYIPDGYFPFFDELFDYVRDECDECEGEVSVEVRDGYIVLELAADAGTDRYTHMRRVLKEISHEAGVEIRGFGDMSVRELADVSGLSVELAALAKCREYSESFLIVSSSSVAMSSGEDDSVCEEKEKGREEDSMKESMEVRHIMEKASERGFRISHGGRFFTIYSGEVDKGRAVRILKALFAKEHRNRNKDRNKNKNIKTYGIGDSANDIPMLSEVDIPALVRRPDGSSCVDIVPEPLRSRIYVTRGAGPEGWVEFVRKFGLVHE